MTPREPLGHLELDVLQYIADHHPITVREVAAHFAEASGHARTTLLTVMQRLCVKGYLTHRKSSGVQRVHAHPVEKRAADANRRQLRRRRIARLRLSVRGLPDAIAPVERRQGANSQLLKSIESRERKDES